MRPFGTPQKPPSGGTNPAIDAKARIVAILEKTGGQAQSKSVYRQERLQDDNALARAAKPQKETVTRKRADHNKRTKEYYKARGYVYSREDVFDGARNLDHDFLGFADAIAMMEDRPDMPVIAVQLTSKENMTARKKKILASRLARVWLSTGNAIEIIGWKMEGARYVETVICVTMEDFEKVK